jgi:hypothetical protein
MAVHKVKRGDRVYLSEYKSVREGEKVKSVFVRYLGPEDEIERGRRPKKRVMDRIQLSRSYKAGDITLLWEIARDLDLQGIIDGICCQVQHIPGPSPGKFLTAWAINRVVDPESCTQLERWVPTTDLPTLIGVEPGSFTKDAFLTSLDFVCYHDDTTHRIVDHTATIDDTLYQRWRHDHPLPSGDRETVAYDLTSVLYFGVTCPLAELGQKARTTGRRQVNLALLVSRHDRYPIAHFVYNGSRNSSSTVKNLIARLSDISIQAGTIVWDRGNVSKDHVAEVEGTGWKLICGIPKASNEARGIVDGTDVPIDIDTFVHKGRTGHIYATRTEGRLFGRERSLVVYVNQERRTGRTSTQHDALMQIGKELDKLSEEGEEWSEARLHGEIDRIVGDWGGCVHTRVRRKGEGPRIEWRYKRREISNRERSYGKYLLLSSDDSLPASEVARAYFEKDFVEKVFRILKTGEDIEPVRHRLEPRVRAYMFVCVLAYRLLSALRSRIVASFGDERAWERTFDLLRDLSRVERTELEFGNEVKTMYLNVPKPAEDVLKKIGMKDLLKEETRLKDV